MTLNTVQTSGLLELVASEHADLLTPLLEVLKGSKSPGLADFARECGIRIGDMAPLCVRTARQLMQLEPRRCGRWEHPNQVVGTTNVFALLRFAHARRHRVQPARARRIHVVAHKLSKVAGLEAAKAQVNALLTEPIKPADTDWLKDFLRRPVEP